MLIVFDWDGTLSDSVPRIVEAMQQAAGETGQPIPDSQAVSEIVGLGLGESIEALFPAASLATREAVAAAYSACYRRLDEVPAPLFPGALVTLEVLRERGHVLAVATGKSRRGLDRVMGGHGVDHLFSSSRCADETRSKPHPAMLLELLDEAATPAHGAVLVGDTEYDLAMARAAGVPSVGVSYGVHAPARLRIHEPLAIVDALEELLSLFD
jgi:phosphoglycolate phosphatase